MNTPDPKEPQILGPCCSPYDIPPGKYVSVQEFQTMFANTRNKQDKIAACIRTLASMGYTAGGWDLFSEYLEPPQTSQ